jgi:hypothetical protein
MPKSYGELKAITRRIGKEITSAEMHEDSHSILAEMQNDRRFVRPNVDDANFSLRHHPVPAIGLCVPGGRNLSEFA